MPVQSLNRSSREAIYQEVLETVQGIQHGFGHDPRDPRSLAGRCLWFAAIGLQVLRRRQGIPRVILQAGSASWPRRPREEWQADDYQYSYIWEPDHPITRSAMAGEFMYHKHGVILPEMHIWLAIPSTGEIIDFTTGLWPVACQETIGMDWPGPRPPDFFWDFRIPEHVAYRPNREASLLAAVLIMKALEEMEG